jgi:hypothetical protein
MVSNRTPYPHPTHCIHIQSILIHTGKVGRRGELIKREWKRCNRGEYRSQSWVENTNLTECMQEIGYLKSINSEKHL